MYVKARAWKRATKVAGRMNKLEAAYAERLDSFVKMGLISSFKYEAVKLRLADNTFYTPDFMVVGSDGTIAMHETKGYWEDDARVKIKVAAEMFPFFIFIGAQFKRKTWELETF